MSTDPPVHHAAPGRGASGVSANTASAAHRRWCDFLAHWGAVVAIATAALCAVAGLGDRVFDHAPGTLDAGVRTWMLAHRTPAPLHAFEWISRVGAPPYTFLLAVIVAVWLWQAQARHVASVVVAAPIVAVAIFNIVKQIVHRTRPAGGLLLRDVTFSFPSGHATASAAVFGTLAWVLAREGKIPWLVAVLLAVLCPLLIGLSRVYLDVHWATDVIAGWCAGAGVAALSAGAYERGRRQRAHAA
ncbi:hypothetical protein tb265_02500 [Gemmatimonadetes bacterium T265]|nr:hypothetical protein tb265_02500 [Gemmatimonadetes bacterium T265]